MNRRLANARAITNQTTFMQYLTFCLTGPLLPITFVQYLIAFHSRGEVTSDVISGRFLGPLVSDNRVKFGDHRLKHSREIPPEAA